MLVIKDFQSSLQHKKIFYEGSRIFQSKHVYLNLNVCINNMQKYLEHIKAEGQN
jgi:hypothetical protein